MVISLYLYLKNLYKISSHFTLQTYRCNCFLCLIRIFFSLSKMAKNFVVDKEYIKVILFHLFVMRVFSSENHRQLTEIYGNLIPNEDDYWKLHKRFRRKNFDFDLEYDEESGGLKLVELNNPVQRENPTPKKKEFYKFLLLQYYGWKRGEKRDEYLKYFIERFNTESRAEQICQYVLQKFVLGDFVFDGGEQREMMRKVGPLEDRMVTKFPMKIIHPIKLFYRRVLIHCFKDDESAAEAYHNLCKGYGRGLEKTHLVELFLEYLIILKKEILIWNMINV